ncbi:FAD-binding protein [Adlercreutzia shanghongiae]|uniref:FAD-binding protein n=1 Tax=Adlercreutzia shanghongiae TaxID=3111773 RepID=A0ABU6IWU9_9ACTN|nr:FAD-binding protein [Adlercreutzia sp. R22]MEC4294315.1 FAD-binding protein [Adlercreutzia sp. R22]
MEKKISRRSFLAGGMAAGMLGAASLAGCAPKMKGEADLAATGESSSRETTVIPSSENFEPDYWPEEGTVAFVKDPITDIAEVKEYDVVVCGCGFAGSCVAASLAENGKQVAILEKRATYGANGYSVAAIGDRVHNAMGVEIDKDRFVSDMMSTAGGYRANEGLIRNFVNRSGEAMDWLLDMVGDKISEPTLGTRQMEIGGITWWASDVSFVNDQMAGVIPHVLDYAQSFGSTDLFYETPACQLIQEETGEITGVIAKTTEGQYVQFNAKDGVVLATGGYEHNVERLRKCLRPRDLMCAAWLNMNSENTGDGHEMGLAVGGFEDEYPHCSCTDPSGTPNHTFFGAAMNSFLRVNAQGERFMNEGIPFDYRANSIGNQIGAHCWTLVDGDVLEHLPRINPTAPYTPEEQLETLEADCFKADTLEELAEMIEVDYETLQKSIDRYNALFDAGQDEDFGTPVVSMAPVRTPPFYAVNESIVHLATVCGLQVTKNSEVLSLQNRRPIPGLYAIGNVSGSMFSTTYPHHISAVSLGRCLTMGYVVGRIISGVEQPL